MASTLSAGADDSERMTRLMTQSVDGGPAGHTLWAALAWSAFAVVWYAMPDYLSSRAHRAVVKAALLAPVGLYGAHLGLKDSGEESVMGAEGPGLAGPHGPVTEAGSIVALFGGAIAAELGMYRMGERLARRGVSRPHTKVGPMLCEVSRRSSQAFTARQSKS